MKKNGTTKHKNGKALRPRVAIQGIATSFHELAAFTYFGGPVDTVECLSFHALCEALNQGQATHAVMAIENSIAGSILPNYFLLTSPTPELNQLSPLPVPTSDPVPLEDQAKADSSTEAYADPSAVIVVSRLMFNYVVIAIALFPARLGRE